ncbi:MAG: O-antigen ligase family protein [Bacteroidetes bacterium]|nr:O-antigen ligase family protein [Bacteroidota bacterium]
MNSIIKTIFSKNQNESVHQLIYFICLCLLIASLPTSYFMISVSLLLMSINWLAERNYKEKIQRFLNNKPAIILASIYLVYIVGMIWTSNWKNGLGFELQNKLPIFGLTFIIASSKALSKERLLALPIIFSLSVLVTTLIGTYFYLTKEIIDTRELSPFVVHIYLSMMIVLVIFMMPDAIRKITHNKKWFYASLIASLWLLFYLLLLSSLTGLLCLIVVIAYYSFRYIFFTKGIVKKVIAILTILALAVFVFIIAFTIASPLTRKINPDNEEMKELTKEGNKYNHNSLNPARENGYFIFYYVAENELREAWEERSNFNFYDRGATGQKIQFTAYRYLTSKGLRKDRESLSSLTDEEISAIENGIANYLYLQWPHPLVRIHKVLWEVQEYNRTGNPSGHTLTQRMDLWRASWAAFKELPLLGWGTGDILEALDYGLTKINSSLENRNMKPHNQILSILLMVGIIGLIIISSQIYFFIKKSNALKHIHFKILCIIFLVSIFSLSPIDSAVGLNFLLFFSLYYGLMCIED